MDSSRRQFLQAMAATTAVGAVAAQPADPRWVRAEFPAATRGLYLNSAYIAPVPRAVAAAGCAFVNAKMERPMKERTSSREGSA